MYTHSVHACLLLMLLVSINSFSVTLGRLPWLNQSIAEDKPIHKASQGLSTVGCKLLIHVSLLYTTHTHMMLLHFIAPLSDIPMYNIKYLTMLKVHMHVGAIIQLLYGCAYVREIIHSLKLVDYLPVHTHKSYNNLHFSFKSKGICMEEVLGRVDVVGLGRQGSIGLDRLVEVMVMVMLSAAEHCRG